MDSEDFDTTESDFEAEAEFEQAEDFSIPELESEHSEVSFEAQEIYDEQNPELAGPEFVRQEAQIAEQEFYSVEGNYDQNSGTIILEGVELQGDPEAISSIIEKFESGYEGLAYTADFQIGEELYQSNYYIEGFTLRIDTVKIGELDSGYYVENSVDTNDSGDGTEIRTISSESEQQAEPTEIDQSSESLVFQASETEDTGSLDSEDNEPIESSWFGLDTQESDNIFNFNIFEDTSSENNSELTPETTSKISLPETESSSFFWTATLDRSEPVQAVEIYDTDIDANEVSSETQKEPLSIFGLPIETKIETPGLNLDISTTEQEIEPIESDENEDGKTDTESLATTAPEVMDTETEVKYEPQLVSKNENLEEKFYQEQIIEEVDEEPQVQTVSIREDNERQPISIKKDSAEKRVVNAKVPDETVHEQEHLVQPKNITNNNGKQEKSETQAIKLKTEEVEVVSEYVGTIDSKLTYTTPKQEKPSTITSLETDSEIIPNSINTNIETNSIIENPNKSVDSVSQEEPIDTFDKIIAPKVIETVDEQTTEKTKIKLENVNKEENPVITIKQIEREAEDVSRPEKTTGQQIENLTEQITEEKISEYEDNEQTKIEKAVEQKSGTETKQGGETKPAVEKRNQPIRLVRNSPAQVEVVKKINRIQRTERSKPINETYRVRRQIKRIISTGPSIEKSGGITLVRRSGTISVDERDRLEYSNRIAKVPINRARRRITPQNIIRMAQAA